VYNKTVKNVNVIFMNLTLNTCVSLSLSKQIKEKCIMEVFKPNNGLVLRNNVFCCGTINIGRKYFAGAYRSFVF
jgi:hypothetical protein